MTTTTAAFAPPPAVAPTPVERVVIIEDSPSDAVMVQSMLAGRNAGVTYVCAVAPTLAEGLLLIDVQRPACVLVDLGLPDSDGLDTLRTVLEHVPDTPIVVFTGLDDDTVGEQAVIHGAQDYLVKGKTDAQLLVRTIRRATERKHTELAARSRDARFRSLLDLAPDAIIATDCELVITFWNRGAESIYGWTSDEAEGQSLDALIDGVHEPDNFQDLLTVGHWEGEATHRTKDGGSTVIEGRWSVVNDDAGDPIGLIGAHRDVSARRAIEDQLAEQADQLERSNAELEQFAYVASHDLAQPLRTIAGFVQLLGARYKGRLDAEADEFIDFALEGVTRMQTMIQDLLTYSRVSRAEYNLVAVDTRALVEQLMETLGVGDAVTISSPLPRVLADAGQLERVFQNLITNALKFVPPDRTAQVDISALDDAGQWHFVVRDNGIGIAAEHRERIFKMFERLHNHEEYPGTGIGLSVCQRIVERHGGRIWLDSVEGEGSTFHFTLAPKNVTR
ncbi:MAG: ATP-binding protein [Acidimicrobiales bacterium]